VPKQLLQELCGDPVRVSLSGFSPQTRSLRFKAGVEGAPSAAAGGFQLRRDAPGCSEAFCKCMRQTEPAWRLQTAAPHPSPRSCSTAPHLPALSSPPQPPFPDTSHYHKQQRLLEGGAEEVRCGCRCLLACVSPGLHMQEDQEPEGTG